MTQLNEQAMRQAARSRLGGGGMLAGGYIQEQFRGPEIDPAIMAEEQEKANRRFERQNMLHVVASLGVTGADNAIEAAKKLIAFINDDA